MRVYKEGVELSHYFKKFKDFPFLRSFEEKYLKQILGASKLIMYNDAEQIIREGEHDDKLYVLFNGKVKVVKNHKTVAIFAEFGEIFGELHMISQQARTASVYSIGTCLCLVIDVSFLRRMPAEDRHACVAMFYGLFLKVIAERLKQTTEELVQVRNRLERLEKKA